MYGGNNNQNNAFSGNTYGIPQQQQQAQQTSGRRENASTPGQQAQAQFQYQQQQAQSAMYNGISGGYMQHPTPSTASADENNNNVVPPYNFTPYNYGMPSSSVSSSASPYGRPQAQAQPMTSYSSMPVLSTHQQQQQPVSYHHYGSNPGTASAGTGVGTGAAMPAQGPSGYTSQMPSSASTQQQQYMPSNSIGGSGGRQATFPTSAAASGGAAYHPQSYGGYAPYTGNNNSSSTSASAVTSGAGTGSAAGPIPSGLPAFIPPTQQQQQQMNPFSAPQSSAQAQMGQQMLSLRQTTGAAVGFAMPPAAPSTSMMQFHAQGQDAAAMGLQQVPPPAAAAATTTSFETAATSQRPTYIGFIKTTEDAIKLLAATDLPDNSPNSPPRRIQRRLLDNERVSLIRSGSVFVWDENEAAMRRWTDGRCWSASRVSGCFLTYRELHVRKQ